jgi:hypothetical protein
MFCQVQQTMTNRNSVIVLYYKLSLLEQMGSLLPMKVAAVIHM